MLILQSQRVVRVVGLMIQLDNNEVVQHLFTDGEPTPMAPVIPASLVQAARTLEAVEVENTPDTPVKPKRRGGRRKKTEAPAESVAPPDDNEQSSRSGSSEGETENEPNARIVVPIGECLGVAEYECKNGLKTVAIYKSGLYNKGRRKGGRWYLCLFLSKSGEYAYTFSAKPFFANPAKMKDVCWFNHTTLVAA